MWKELKGLFRRESLCDEAFKEALAMLDASRGMFLDAVSSLWKEGPLDVNIYARDQQINKYERSVRRKIVTHLAIRSNPDANMALVLTSIVIDIERIGDYTKNIIELAAETHEAFHAGALEAEIRVIERTVTGMFADIIPALQNNDMEKARKIIADHEELADMVESRLRDLVTGDALSEDSGAAVISALYLRYLKRISAHLKNVATSVVNPYHRIGFREKASRWGGLEESDDDRNWDDDEEEEKAAGDGDPRD